MGCLFLCPQNRKRHIFYRIQSIKKDIFCPFKHSPQHCEEVSALTGSAAVGDARNACVHITYVNTIYFFFFGTLFPSKWSGVRYKTRPLPELKGVKAKKTLQRGLTAVLWAARLKTYSLKYKING